MRILLIDDEEKLALHLQKGLNQAGYAVDVALSGAAGLEQAAMGTYDLILLDLMLPGTTGFDLLRNLRDFTIDTPVMILSALNQSQHVVRGWTWELSITCGNPLNWMNCWPESGRCSVGRPGAGCRYGAWLT
ncbi:response regulator transcription factor [Spirosoma rhododendri]|uniref:response regulator transcription factor n=1 Tax=Spirosoma rhododendri TaxID=2728024 RepID=UPI0020C2F4CF|nr:response regulator [Spirosoma rhododendri]